MTALRRSTLAAAMLAAVLTFAAAQARAEAPKPTAIVSLPVGFYYTHDANTKGVDNATPTGLQGEFLTPWYLGVGAAQYKSAILAKSWNVITQDLEMTYQFLEVSANVKLGPVLLGWGYGSGSVDYSPSVNPAGVTWKKSQAFERFIRIGLHVTPDWSVHAAWHALYAEADQEFGGIKHRGDIGAILTTAGVGYSF